MNIQFPPVGVGGHFYVKIADHILEFNGYFGDEVFDSIYYSQFEWFRKELQCTDKILSLGCGAGRETFALMWELKAVEAVGVDIDHKKIEHAKQRTQDIREFAEIMRRAFAETDDNGQLRAWYENVPVELRDCVIPEFCPGNICENLLESTSRPDRYFDLVYCRNALYFIADEGKDKLHLAFQNIARAVKSRTGRIVIVEPTTKNGFEYDFGSCFEQAGLTLTKDPPEDRDSLGYLKMPETNPKGYILQMKASE